MKEIYCYKGSTKETHSEIVSLGVSLGLQHCRHMSIGDKIAELANDGDARAARICAENPHFFSFVCFF